MWGSLQQVCGAGMALAQGGRGVAGTRLNLHLGWSRESKRLEVVAVLSSSHSPERREGMLTFTSQNSEAVLRGSGACLEVAVGKGVAAAVPPSERQRVGCRGRCWLIVSGKKWEAI